MQTWQQCADATAGCPEWKHYHIVSPWPQELPVARAEHDAIAARVAALEARPLKPDDDMGHGCSPPCLMCRPAAPPPAAAPDAPGHDHYSGVCPTCGQYCACSRTPGDATLRVLAEAVAREAVISPVPCSTEFARSMNALRAHLEATR